MDEKRKKELEGMFKAVQDLKDEYYVGTKEAFEIIKSCQRIYSNPEKVSEIINTNLSYMALLDYPATPERIVGLERVIESCSRNASDDMDEIYKGNRDVGFIDFYLRELSEKFRIIPMGDEILFEKDVEKSSERFFDVFRIANENKVKSDNLLKSTVINYFLDSYSEIKDEIPEKIKDYSDEWMRKFLNSLVSLDWNLYFSKEEFRVYEKEKLGNTRNSVSLKNMVEKIKKDQLDHRLEYRRMILCKWLRESNVGDYKEAISAIERSIRERKEILERLRKLDSPTVEEGEKYLDSSKFIRHLIGSDKSFIEKYLRS